MSKNKGYNNVGAKEDDALWDYVSGDMSASKAHDTELEHVDDPFWNDATEGLAAMKDAALIKKMQLQLQQQIVNKTQTKKKMRKRNFQQSALIASLVVIFLVVMAYLLVHFSTK